jgi:membrane carboxypeptidase/penicillin-binding protein
VVTRDGKLLESREVKMKRVAPASVCYVMDDMLEDVLHYGSGAKVRQLGFTREFAGKTGTTSNYRDAWFIGYSPRILSLVWIGFDDGHSVRLAGGDACVPIWTAHMTQIAGLVPDVDWKRPDDVVTREIDPESGMLATPYCPTARREIFVSGTEPSAVCPLHAGSGEPNPLWREGSSPIPTILEGPPPTSDEQHPPADEQKQEEQRRKERDKGIKRLLRIIFGNQ